MATKPAVLFSACTFDNPSGKPYIELYMTTTGKSVTAVKKPDGKYQGTILVQVLVKKDKENVYADKYNLNSLLSAGPVLDSNLVDLQRIALANGTYKLEVKITDNHAVNPEPFIIQQEFIINYPSDHLSISGIELLESYGKPGNETRFIKNGISMVPYPDNYFPPSITSLKFYTEIYHADLAFGNDSNFILRYRVESTSGKPIASLGGIRKEKASKVNVLLAEIPFDNLQSGNYNLSVEAVSRDNKVLASKKASFQRSREVLIPLAKQDLTDLKLEGSFAEKITNADTLKEYIRCLYPIADKNERAASAELVKGNTTSQLTKEGKLVPLQSFFLRFWASRNYADPEGAWLAYKAKVDLVNANYKTWNKKGYETDRGRVYLEYGVPNEIETQYYDNNTYPNELWHYYTLNDQRNRIFVFYCTNFSTNDFELIHSDATGEITDYRYQDRLTKIRKDNSYNNWDPTK